MVFVYDWGEQLTKDDLPLDSAGDDCVKSTHIECRRDDVKVLTDIDYRKCTTATESVKQGFLRLVLSPHECTCEIPLGIEVNQQCPFALRGEKRA